MRRIVVVVIAFALSTGCATSGSRVPFDYDPALLDGTAVFGHPVAAAPVEDLLWVSPEMSAFVLESTEGRELAYSRFRRLMQGMVEDGFFIDQYDRTATFAAAETFKAHKGNCLSYTNMFIALAREADLNARFQLVRGRPTWDVEAGFLVRNNHVNVVVENVQLPGYDHTDVTVDFNNVVIDPDTPRHAISDEYAASLYYGNKAIERLHLKDYEGMFAQLKRAILTYEQNGDLWNNMGALFSILGAHDKSEAAYRVAMAVDPRDKTAVSGLAKALQTQGRLAEAEEYAALARKYQNNNPYYHYAIAEAAFNSDAPETALASINQAIELKRNNARFYALRAELAKTLGDEALMEQSLKLHKKYTRGKRSGGFAPSTSRAN